jgi:hypothetical protein
MMWADHAMPQVVSHRLPIAADLVQFQFRLCGICGGRSSTGAGLLQILQFSPSNSTPSMADCCEHGNELPGSINGKEFLAQKCNCKLFKRNPAPWT